MKAQCGVCLTDYTIDDAKVIGRVAKIRCTKCQGVVVVDGTKLTARATGAMPVQPTPSGSMPVPRSTAFGVPSAQMPAQPAPPAQAQPAPMVKPMAGEGSKFDAPAPVSDPQRVALANTLDGGAALANTLPVAGSATPPVQRDQPRDAGSPVVNVGPKAFAQTMPPTAGPAIRPTGQQPTQPPPMPPRPSAQQPVAQPPPMPPRPSAQQPVAQPPPMPQQPVAQPPPMPPPPTPRPRAPTMSPTAGIPAVRPPTAQQPVVQPPPMPRPSAQQPVAQPSPSAQQPVAQPSAQQPGEPARPMMQAHRPAKPSAPPPIPSMPSHVAVPAPKPIPPKAAAAAPTPHARRERAPRARPQKAGLPQFRPRNVTALARGDASLPFAPRVPRDATVAAPKVDFDVPIEFNFEGHYDVLGVPRAATAEEVKKAAFDMFGIYDRRARKGGDETATQRLQKVNEAQDVLGKPDKRAKYDRESEALFLTIQDPYPYERVAWNDGLDMIRELTMSSSDADPMRAIDAKIDDKERPNAILDELLR